MAVTVVDVRVMRMAVTERRMDVEVGMRGVTDDGKVMRMLVMLVMRVSVTVRERVVTVRMRMPLADMQPDPEAHETRGQPECGRRRFV